MNIAEKRQMLNELIDSTRGKFFSVTVFKKGEFNKGNLVERTMRGRTGVKVFLKGGVKTTAGKEDLVTIHESGNDYRCVWLDGVSSFTFKGKTTTFDIYPEFKLMTA